MCNIYIIIQIKLYNLIKIYRCDTKLFASRIPNEKILSEFKDTELETGYLYNINKFEIIIKYNGDIKKVAQELNFELEILSENYAIGTIEINKVQELIKYTEIEHIETPKTLTINLQDALSKSCVTSLNNSKDFNLTGKDVIIGIIDSGIDYTHPDFINSDNTSRILYIWDQTININTDNFSNNKYKVPDGFTHGVEFTNQDINEALRSSNPYEIVPHIDTIGHGTAVAGIAAGNGRSSDGQNAGVAPEASLIIVKLGEKGFPSFARTTEFMRALKYIIDKAQKLNMPVCINISYGTNDGPHNGQSLFENFINNMAERWKTSIIVASGNEGAVGHHFQGKINSGELKDVQFFYAGKYPSFYITMWKNFVDNITVELILPDNKTTGEILSFDMTRNYTIGDLSIFVNYSQPQFYNSFQEIFFQIKSNQNTPPVGIYTIRVRAGQIVSGNFNIYLPTTEEVSRETSFTNPSTNSTLTIPSSAQNVITVGGYDSSRGIISDFSGRGYTLNIIYTKPDLVAPSVGIITTKINGGYTAYSGTSMAAPFVTGSAALMMQWGIIQRNDPFLYGEKIKSYLKSGAQRLPNIIYPNNSWGYGSLCLYNTMTQLKNFNN